MLEKPNLPDELLINYLQHLYGLSAVELEFLPIGNDATAWVYKVSSDKLSKYFLKVKRQNIVPAGVLVSYSLHQSGIIPVVSAIPNQTHDLWTTIQDFILILYPFIEGKSGMDVGLSLHQWQEFGAILKQIHATTLPPKVISDVSRESFVLNPNWMRVIREIQKTLSRASLNDDLVAKLAAFWQEHNTEIVRIISRTIELGRLLQARSLPFVLCHSDIHIANILVDGEGQLYIVDWDETRFAPKERDLMFIFAGIEPDNESEHAFLQSYGKTALDPLALAYYRYEWVVQEISDFGERICLTQNVGPETKVDALRGFKQLFESGDVVDAAYKADRYLT